MRWAAALALVASAGCRPEPAAKPAPKHAQAPAAPAQHGQAPGATPSRGQVARTPPTQRAAAGAKHVATPTTSATPRAGAKRARAPSSSAVSWTRHRGATELSLHASALVPGRLAQWDARWTDHRRGEPLDTSHLSVTEACAGTPPRPRRLAERGPGRYGWRWTPRTGCKLTLRAFTPEGSVAMTVALSDAPDDPSAGFALSKAAQWQAQVRVAPVGRRLLRAALETEAVVHAAPDAQRPLRAPAAGRVARVDAGPWPRAQLQVRKGQPLLRLVLDARRALEGLPEPWLPQDASRRDRQGLRAVLTAHSPALGRVSKVAVHPGQRLRSGHLLLTVVDETRLTLQVRLPPQELKTMGDKLQLLLLPEHERAVVVPMGAAVADANGDLTVPYRSPRRRWRHGERVPAAVEFGPAQDVVAVPTAAVLAAGAQRYVFVQRAGERFERRVVTLGAWSGDAYPVRAGLVAGEHVVVSGFDRVREALAAARSAPSAPAP